MGRLWRLAAVVAVASGLATPAQAEQRGAAAGTEVAGTLNAVACASAADCWAVGILDSTEQGVTENWNGSAWKVVASADPAGAKSVVLDGVACASAADCWAVGSYTNSNLKDLPYAERWNGTAWSGVTVPNPADAPLGAWLDAVSCPSATQCFAIGNYDRAVGHVGYPDDLVESWNGSSWKVVPDPVLPNSTTYTLQALSCPGTSDCWATGSWLNQPSAQEPPLRGGYLGYHWNGTKWTAVAIENDTYANAGDLNTISCPVAQLCLGIGSKGHHYTEQWNGSSWTTARITLDGYTGWSVLSVSCATATMCMAAGNITEPTANDTFAVRWNGTAWVNTPSQTPPDATNGGLQGVACPQAGSCWAVGFWNNGSDPMNAFIERWNGKTWTTVQS
jgi:hypothetical protein